MKNKITSLFVLALLVLAVSCTKSGGNDLWKYENLGQGEVLKFDTPGAVIRDALDFTNLSASSVSYKLQSYGTLNAVSVNVYASTNNSADTTKWRRIKNVPLTADKATVVVSATELATALGVPLSSLTAGTQYTLYNQVVTAEGLSFSTANLFGDYESGANYNHGFRFTVTVGCPFNPATSAGNYTIITDPWDGAAGEVVTATATANTVRMILFPYAAPPGVGSVTVTISNLASGAATVSRQTYGSYGAGFENFRCEGTGFVFSCTGRITLRLQHTLPSGTNYGTYLLELQK